MGLFLGFYFHGVSYLFVIFHFSVVHPLMKFLPKEHVYYPTVAVSTLLMFIRSFYMSWEGNLDSLPRLQCTVIWMRTIMMVSIIDDTLALNDPIRSKNLKSYEREAAERLKDIPTFFEWFHYNCFGPLSWMG